MQLTNTSVIMLLWYPSGSRCLTCNGLYIAVFLSASILKYKIESLQAVTVWLTDQLLCYPPHPPTPISSSPPVAQWGRHFWGLNQWAAALHFGRSPGQRFQPGPRSGPGRHGPCCRGSGGGIRAMDSGRGRGTSTSLRVHRLGSNGCSTRCVEKECHLMSPRIIFHYYYQCLIVPFFLSRNVIFPKCGCMLPKILTAAVLWRSLAVPPNVFPLKPESISMTASPHGCMQLSS